MGASVTTVSKLGATVKNHVLCYCIKNVEIYIFEIDCFKIPNQYSGHFHLNKCNTYFINFYDQSIPKVKILFYLVLKMIYILFLLNVYVLYTYIHFHVVPNPELVVMLTSIGIIRFHLGANIVMYKTDSESMHIPVCFIPGHRLVHYDQIIRW